ncbi:hypothetical protein [Geodermatophilus ruber]|uniref:DUF3040 domain-containing protein n=1 Tax=Geodermatophilus ruber TaxID=504800 RepID=A0A1I3ZH23_9ACTN|nr:hypothetical protein [Geodermatophilus ruber]SFK43355.1 hypothetical protein SAMN04488085_101542 [Geodermatophilus ruber]
MDDDPELRCLGAEIERDDPELAALLNAGPGAVAYGALPDDAVPAGRRWPWFRLACWWLAFASIPLAIAATVLIGPVAFGVIGIALALASPLVVCWWAAPPEEP